MSIRYPEDAAQDQILMIDQVIFMKKTRLKCPEPPKSLAFTTRGNKTREPCQTYFYVTFKTDKNRCLLEMPLLAKCVNSNIFYSFLSRCFAFMSLVALNTGADRRYFDLKSKPLV
jgi:hypothetical protein